jgi:hypothetical protein
MTDLRQIGCGLLSTVVLIVVTILIFRSCQKPPDIVLSELDAKEISAEELIYINNCNGTGTSEQTVERSFTTTLEASAQSALDAKVVEESIGAKYGQNRLAKASLKVQAPPGTHMKFVIRVTEKKHALNVLVDNKPSGTYSVRVPVSMQQISATNLGCGGLKVPTTIPLSTPTSTWVPEPPRETSWIERFLEYFPFGYQPLNLFRWMYDDSTLDDGFLGVVIFIVRLVLAGVLFFIDLFLTILLGIGAVLNMFFGSLVMNIYLAVAALAILGWMFSR